MIDIPFVLTFFSLVNITSVNMIHDEAGPGVCLYSQLHMRLRRKDWLLLGF